MPISPSAPANWAENRDAAIATDPDGGTLRDFFRVRGGEPFVAFADIAPNVGVGRSRHLQISKSPPHCFSIGELWQFCMF
jgi:hypothetical protein